MFDPEKFGAAMGEAIRNAVEPLHEEIARLKSQIEAMPRAADGNDGADGRDGRDGKDCDMDAVKAMVADFLKSIPAPANGKDGNDGKDGSSVTIDDVRPLLDEAIKSIREESREILDLAIKAIPAPKDGRDGRDGVDGKDGAPGEKGADGIGMAGAMIDRDGALQITTTNGEVKSLGVVVGSNGRDGADGKDGIGLDSFDIEYIAETHEIAIKASAAGRTKELRYPAGGIRPAGYWRDGTKAKAGEAWVHDGSLWIAMKETASKPATNAEGWIIAARKGRDGETVVKKIDNGPAKPINLSKKDD